MKWIQTRDNALIRLGAVSAFIFDGNSLKICFGEKELSAFSYLYGQQADEEYVRLKDFILDSDSDNEIFSFGDEDKDFFLQNYDIALLELSDREERAYRRSGIENLYDFISSDGFARGVSQSRRKELRARVKEIAENLKKE